MDDRTRKHLNLEHAADAARLEQMGLPAVSRYHDRQGKPMGLGDWTACHETHEYRVVDRTVVGGVAVSTVWRGMHSNIEGPPLIFETLVFDETVTERALGIDVHPKLEGFDRRYATEDDARAGHAEVVAEVRATLQQDSETPER